MSGEGPSRRLTRVELTEAVPVPPEELESMIQNGMLVPHGDDSFRPSDIQRVRAILAMRSSGLSVEELRPAFDKGAFTLQPMDILYPDPSPASRQTFAELAAALGFDVAQLGRLMIAAGFPAPQPDERVREDDAALVRLLVETGNKLGGGEILMRTARIFGESARRAAEGGLALYNEGVERPLLLRDRQLISDPELMRAANELAADLMGLAEQLLARLLRRHLEHGLVVTWAVNAELTLSELGIRPVQQAPPGMAFVDLAGYSSMTEAGGDDAAASMASVLSELAELSSARHGGRVVKLLGDGAMLHFRDRLDAARGALDLVAAIGSSNLPPARGGVHAGPVIERDGDYFGRTVNTAARIAAQAQPGQVLVSVELARDGAHDIDFRPIGEREMKGVGSLPLFEVISVAR